MVHPALRPGVNILDTSIPLPELDPREVQQHMEDQKFRQSAMTTMSPFLNAGLDGPPPVELSVDLDLGTTPEHTPQPTQRAFIEDRQEQLEHERLETAESRIPVYRHTPKPAAEEFSAPKSTTKKTVEFSEPPRTPATRSPKKGLLDRFSKWTGLRTTPSISEQDEFDAPHMGPKARAILGEAPTKKALGRSPSKPKGLFSRRKSDANEIVSAATPRPEPARAATSLGHRTSDFPSHLPRPKTQSQLDTAHNTPRTPASSFGIKSALSRTQSLKYLENSIPPTPPAKDTPPDQQSTGNDSKPQQRFTSFHHETPSRGFVSTSGRISPTRLGSYGSRGEAQLVTQPSMYSLRASVVPGAMEASAFEDAKSRLGGLGIEGFNMPHETNRNSAHTVEYSPSIYSPENFRKSVARFPEKAAERIGRKISASRKFMDEYERRNAEQMRESPDTTQSATSDVGSIPVIYPELAKDPSIASFMTFGFSPPQPGAMDKAFVEVEQMVKEEDSRDSLVDPESSPASASSSKEGLFAIPLDRGKIHQQPEEDASTAFKDFDSDVSPMAHHPSAIPSPLRNSDGLQYLPATTYTPCRPRSRKKPKNTLQLPRVEEKKSVENMFSPFDPPWTPGGRPKPAQDLFKNKPNFNMPEEDLVVRQSPPIGGTAWLAMDAATAIGDPKKSSEPRSPSPQKVDFKDLADTPAEELVTMQDPMNSKWENVVAMIQERDNVIRDLHKNMQADNARIHQRVASIEIREREEQKRARVAKRTSNDQQKDRKRSSSPIKRISTSHAQDYYRAPPKSEDEKSPVDSVSASVRSMNVTTPDIPPPAEPAREDSPTLGSSHLNATVNAATRAVADANAQQQADGEGSALTRTHYDELMTVIRQQNDMMTQMMLEIKQLKQNGTRENGSS